MALRHVPRADSPDLDQHPLWGWIHEAPEVLLYKHSPHCWSAVRAEREIRALLELRPDLAVLQVDVVHQRPLARLLGERLGIRHESPQVILFRDGSPVWHTSHSGVTVEAVTDQLDAPTRS